MGFDEAEEVFRLPIWRDIVGSAMHEAHYATQRNSQFNRRRTIHDANEHLGGKGGDKEPVKSLEDVLKHRLKQLKSNRYYSLNRSVIENLVEEQCDMGGGKSRECVQTDLTSNSALMMFTQLPEVGGVAAMGIIVRTREDVDGGGHSVKKRRRKQWQVKWFNLGALRIPELLTRGTLAFGSMLMSKSVVDPEDVDAHFVVMDTYACCGALLHSEIFPNRKGISESFVNSLKTVVHSSCYSNRETKERVLLENVHCAPWYSGLNSNSTPPYLEEQNGGKGVERVNSSGRSVSGAENLYIMPSMWSPTWKYGKNKLMVWRGAESNEVHRTIFDNILSSNT